jgi:hypothetical protein
MGKFGKWVEIDKVDDLESIWIKVPSDFIKKNKAYFSDVVDYVS